MPLIDLAARLIQLLADAFNGRKSEADIAKQLITEAFEMGVPSAILAEHLTAQARKRAELAADIAQYIKTGGP